LGEGCHRGNRGKRTGCPWLIRQSFSERGGESNEKEKGNAPREKRRKIWWEIGEVEEDLLHD